MQNSINSQTNTVNTVKKLTDKINSTCDQLIGLLEITKNEINNHSQKITDIAISSDFIDRIVNNLLLLKNHISSIQKHAKNHFQDKNDIIQITKNLLKTTEKLKNTENNTFKNTFGLLVDEISNLVDETIAKIQ